VINDAYLETEQKPGTLERSPTSDSSVTPPVWLRLSAWCVAAIAGFLQAWTSRFFITPDGNSYLDVATAYLRHDWSSALNGWWSPMLSWILGAVIYLTKLPPFWETPAIHMVDFAGFLVSLLSFEFFLRSVLKKLGPSQIDRTTWWLFGYSLFLSTSLYVLDLSNPTPDVWVAAATYLASGIIVRIRAGATSYMIFACLGVVLALGYLFKTFFFPWSFVILFTAWFATGSLRKTLPQAIVAALLFSALSGPFVFALSHAKHRVTFGDTGRLAYFMFIARTLQAAFWQGENNTGLPKHPTRQLLKTPRLYEFATPLNASYPPYYDMSYWLEGAKIRFNFRGQLAALRQSAGTFYLILLDQAILLTGLLVLIFSLNNWPAYLSSLGKLWYLWLPSLLACIAYSIVLVEGRYVAPFILVLSIAALAGVSSSGVSLDRRVIRAVALAMCCLISVRIAKSAVSEVIALRSSPMARENVDWEVAQGLQALGFSPGDAVAGVSIMGKAHWARLAGVRVIAEIPLGEELTFWSADTTLRREIMDTFAGTGARAIITEAPPLCADKTEWKQLPHTDYYVYLLKQR